MVGNLRTLIGVGTGICGASAIAAVTPVIGAVSIEVAYAVSTIFLFNVAAVVVFPVVGHALGMSQHAFGLFAGTAVNDTSSVVAAASTYGSGGGGLRGRREAGPDAHDHPGGPRPRVARRTPGRAVRVDSGGTWRWTGPGSTPPSHPLDRGGHRAACSVSCRGSSSASCWWPP
ncbi:putative sulfate exporter family transporter [Curtobacterium sp. MCPF17_052]|uniref:putative sulfate exporter family transporter n=1 Tax=Curtobacterium sp. MCPF17_052 TaxID=2175655 RepID=UPI0024DF7FBA|nr:putative sulfate exporter family transporter [Curtobacterium sp. MCPF17_052]WIB13861.1 putative sulfate exporter family transporter [Curtobacterium sp. MCPF17_052]